MKANQNQADQTLWIKEARFRFGGRREPKRLMLRQDIGISEAHGLITLSRAGIRGFLSLAHPASYREGGLHPIVRIANL